MLCLENERTTCIYTRRTIDTPLESNIDGTADKFCKTMGIAGGTHTKQRYHKRTTKPRKINFKLYSADVRRASPLIIQIRGRVHALMALIANTKPEMLRENR